MISKSAANTTAPRVTSSIQDLDKAIHYLQKKREMLSANMARKTRDEINSALVGSDLRFRNPAEL